MSNISITNTADNDIRFDAVIDGLKVEDTSINFVICSEGVNLTFKATQLESSSWSVKIPPQASLTKPSYDFFIEVIASEYYFKPITGVVDIISKTVSEVKPSVSITLKTDEPEAAATSVKQQDTIKETVKAIPVTKKAQPRSSKRGENLLKSLSESSKERLTTKDSRVREILKSIS